MIGAVEVAVSRDRLRLINIAFVFKLNSSSLPNLILLPVSCFSKTSTVVKKDTEQPVL